MSFRVPALTPDQRKDLADAKRQLAAIEREVKRVKGPGIDTSEAEATIARYKAIIAHYEKVLTTQRAGVD
jgi:hypothetical protein